VYSKRKSLSICLALIPTRQNQLRSARFVPKTLPFGAQDDQLKYCVVSQLITADKSIRNYVSARFGSLPT
jgi:hypothetical protein